MTERLSFVVKTKCGDSFNGKMEFHGHWHPKRLLRIDIAGRGKVCDLCKRKPRWAADGRHLNRFDDYVCPARGMLVSKNGKEVDYPLADDMN